MKIAVCGTQCIGKSTYLQDFKKKWPMYTLPEISYRDEIKEKGLTINEDATEESQEAILDCLIKQASQYSKSDNVILDRCVLDNLAYTSWLYLNDKVSEEYLQKTRLVVKESLKLYDIIFFFPLTKHSPVNLVDDGVRSVNPVYREEIDNIFKAFYQSYLNGTGAVFPLEDAPAVIEIFGNEEQRIALTEMYITETGNSYGEDQSLISDLEGVSTEDIAKFSKTRHK